MKPYSDYFKDLPKPTSTHVFIGWDGYESKTFDTYKEAYEYCKKGVAPNKVRVKDTDADALRNKMYKEAMDNFFTDLHKEFPVLTKEQLETMYWFFNDSFTCNTIEAIEACIEMLTNIGLIDSNRDMKQEAVRGRVRR